ncbi:hypothetical protein QAD02_022623 [Eretmocerus hayati]|uniref:Uncharacterized protein n=1 Tax=Eretmocerus hayati TaxID=131215 RepID=A0ACC2PTB6_9HYME|nr:hypothetical protein QAD02_022623 [Eretmocerus hayati]
MAPLDVYDDDPILVDDDDINYKTADPLDLKGGFSQRIGYPQARRRKGGSDGEKFSMEHVCYRCNKAYTHKKTLIRHLYFECGVPPRFQCCECPYRARQKVHMKRHIRIWHKDGKMKFMEYPYTEEFELDKNYK